MFFIVFPIDFFGSISYVFFHQKTVKKTIQNILTYFTFFSSIFRRFGVPFWSPDGATKDQKGDIFCEVVSEGSPGPPKRLFWGPRDAILGLSGDPLGPFWEPFGSMMGPKGVQKRTKKQTHEILGPQRGFGRSQRQFRGDFGVILGVKT